MNSEKISQLIQRLAPKINATTFIEPRYKKCGMIFFQNGKSLFFKHKHININTSSTAAITRNKFETNCFLKYLGYKVPVGQTFSKYNYDIKHNRGIDDGLQFIKEIGFPVILKPNNMSQGILVCKVNNEMEYYEIAEKILSKKGNILLIEKFYEHYADYRIIVLGNKVISAYQRVPLSVLGDGHSSILELLEEKKGEFERIGRPAKEINVADFRLEKKLKDRKMNLTYIPLKNEKVVLLDNTNLSSGGTTIELTDKIADGFKDLAISVTEKMNLSLSGIDILTPDITKYSDNYVILEINSAPGLDNYAYYGDKQQEYVDDLYLQVLKFVENR